MHLPQNRQIQLIADILKTGTPIVADPDDLDPPWLDLYLWILESKHNDPQRLQYEFWQAHSNYGECQVENFEEIYYPQIKAAIASPQSYTDAAGLVADFPDLRWLWPGWLLQGLPSLLAAAPGTGKSYLALDIARRIIAETTWPDGARVDVDGPILFVDAENTPAIHKQRLSVWPTRALERLYIMLPDKDRFLINLDDFQDRERLRDMAYVIKPALIIVDSYGAATLRGENNKEDVQSLLAFFTHVAAEFDCGLLIIHHLRKSGGGQLSFVPLTIDSIRGSSHIVAMSRHIWGLQFVPTGPDETLTDPRRLWVMKSNVGTPPDPLGVQFSPHPSSEDVAALTYGDAPIPFREPTRVEECADWLLATLHEIGEPTPPADLVELGEQDGYYQSIIYRSRKQLGDLIMDTETRFRHPDNRWALPEWLDDPNRSINDD